MNPPNMNPENMPINQQSSSARNIVQSIDCPFQEHLTELILTYAKILTSHYEYVTIMRQERQVIMTATDLRKEPKRVVDVHFENEELVLFLVDGTKSHTPLTWYPKLAQASDEARSAWKLLHYGTLISWPALDLTFNVPLLAKAKGPLINIEEL
jgi:hypothetical protein